MSTAKSITKLAGMTLETLKHCNLFESLELEAQLTESVFMQRQPAQPPHLAMDQEIYENAVIAQVDVPSCLLVHNHDVPPHGAHCAVSSHSVFTAIG